MTLLNRLSLKTRLLLLVLAIALPAFTIVVTSYLEDRRHRIAESQENSRPADRPLQDAAARDPEVPVQAPLGKGGGGGDPRGPR